MKHLCFFYSFLLFGFWGLNAQTTKPADTLYCNYLGQEQGLLQLNIKGMTLDKLGYLWAGTEDGLHRFNGYTFKPYLHNPKDSTSISDDHIRGLLFDKDTLWVATNTHGINGYIPSKNKFFKAFSNYNNPDLNTSYEILSLNKNVLLFTVKNSIIIYDKQTKTERLLPLPKSAIATYVKSTQAINDSIYWLGTSASGILEFNIKTKTLKQLEILKDENDITLYSHEDIILIGTTSGFYQYNLKAKTLLKTSLEASVNCFYKKSDSQIYIGTKSGLFLYNTSKNHITPVALQTNTNGFFKTIDINQIVGDNKGNLWMGTEADGMFYFNVYQKKFNTVKVFLKEYPTVNSVSPFQFLKGKDSTLWIGSKYGVVNYSHLNKQLKLYKTPETPLIYTIAQDINNTIWAGGFTSGLLKYNEPNDVFETINIPNLPDRDIIEIIPINSKTIWICTWSGGIYKYNISANTIDEIIVNGNRLNRARISLIDSKKNVWLGTDTGVYKVSNEGVLLKHYNSIDKNKISNDRIFSIKEDQLGNIWFGTSVGITKLKLTTEETTLFYQQKGLPSDFIYSILITDDHKLWVSTNFGLSVLDIKTNTFKSYTVSDGLQNNEFNGKCGYQDQYGNFYFGGIGGINIFNPNQITENPHLPKTYIESVEIFNKPLLKNELYSKQLKFNHTENVLTFNFAALNYLNPEKCNYTYKMEGFDLDWRPVTKQKSTTYTNLDPGNYTFKVKASNDIGLWNDEPDTLNIIIVPPWYKTLAFNIIAGLILLLSGPLFYKYKTQKLKSDKRKLEHLVEIRTEEIQAKNKDLNQAYKKADKQRKNITFLMRELTHRVKNNLQIISSLLNIQANNIDDNLAVGALKVAKNRILTISHIENKISNNKEILALDSFIRDISNSVISALSDDEHLKFKVTYNLEKTMVKNVNTTMLGLILNELITNTTKYAFDHEKPENKLEINCSLKKSVLKLVVKDNGKGYSKDEQSSHKSLGLELVSEMVEQLNGTLQINSTNGTENCIEIPI